MSRVEDLEVKLSLVHAHTRIDPRSGKTESVKQFDRGGITSAVTGAQYGFMSRDEYAAHAALSPMGKLKASSKAAYKASDHASASGTVEAHRAASEAHLTAAKAARGVSAQYEKAHIAKAQEHAKAHNDLLAAVRHGPGSKKAARETAARGRLVGLAALHDYEAHRHGKLVTVHVHALKKGETINLNQAAAAQAAAARRPPLAAAAPATAAAPAMVRPRMVRPDIAKKNEEYRQRLAQTPGGHRVKGGSELRLEALNASANAEKASAKAAGEHSDENHHAAQLAHEAAAAAHKVLNDAGIGSEGNRVRQAEHEAAAKRHRAFSGKYRQ